MTEQPNTAAIREGSAAFPADLLWHRTQTLALCDALDAARADTAEADRVWRMWKSRAEAAEARIAASLAVYHAGDWPTSGFPVSDRMAHALTEGTGQ